MSILWQGIWCILNLNIANNLIYFYNTYCIVLVSRYSITMSKSFLLIILTCTLLFSQSFAQETSIYWGKSRQIPKKSNIGKILGTDNFGLYTLRFQKKGWGKSYAYLERYDRSLSLEFSSEMVLPNAKGQELTYEELFYLGNQFLMFSSFYDKERGVNYAYAHRVNRKGEVDKESLLVDSIKSVNNRKIGSFDFVISKDSSKILVYHNEPFSKGVPEKFSYIVLNRNLQVIWAKKIELPYKEENYMITDYQIDNAGNVYQLGKVIKEKENKQKRYPSFKYVILAYFFKSDLMKEYEIDLGPKYISEITFKNDKNNNLVCAGFYSNSSSLDIFGTFYLRIDANTKLVTAKGTKDFDKKLLMKFMSSRKADKGKELSSFKLRDLVLRDDGGAVLLAEQYYLEVVRTLDPNYNTERRTDYYHYNEIVVININPDASIAWSNVIPKRQTSINDGGYYLSYAMAIVRSNIYIVYNDDTRNIGVYSSRNLFPLNRTRRAMVTLVSIEKNGEFSKSQLFDAKDQKTILRPKISEQLNQTQLLIYGERGNSYLFGSIKFNAE